MMDTIIKENGITFKELEKNIFQWVCEMGRTYTAELLQGQSDCRYSVPHESWKRPCL